MTKAERFLLSLVVVSGKYAEAQLVLGFHSGPYADLGKFHDARLRAQALGKAQGHVLHTAMVEVAREREAVRR